MWWGFALIVILFVIGVAIGGGITLIVAKENLMGICTILCALGCFPWLKMAWGKAELTPSKA